MAAPFARKYSCKDEELPRICYFAAFSFKRDLADFNAYSPLFDDKYYNSFIGKIAVVTELVEPKSEIIEQRIITERFYSIMDSMIDPINRLTGYVEMVEASLKHTPTDFGLTELREGIYKKDTENVIKNLHTVNENIGKHKEILTTKGLKEELIGKFASAYTQVSDDKQKQFEIGSNRQNIVQNNLGELNGLYDQLTEILSKGKMLYKFTDPAKLKEYTFSELKKRVRKVNKPVSDESTEPEK